MWTSRPQSKAILATLAAFAQDYSDNLSTETKKGKTERKAQGLCNGLLPFRLNPNQDGVPVPDQVAIFLRNLSLAWNAATWEPRNALARLVFKSFEIEDDRVVAVVPQPDFAPFFVKRAMDEGLVEVNTNGATQMTPSSEVMNGRKRRGSVTRDRCCYVASRSVPLSRPVTLLGTTIRHWALCRSGQRTAHPEGRMGRGGRPS